MTYGHLTLVTGPMMAGKTTDIQQSIAEAETLGRNYVVIKPRFDNRYSNTHIVSHDAVATEAVSVGTYDEVLEATEGADLIFIDEAQFFAYPLFLALSHTHPKGFSDVVRELLAQGKEIIANGLDLDVHGQPWPVTADLAAMADRVIKLVSWCSVCGNSATKTARIACDDPEQNHEDHDGLHVELGASEKYEPRCNQHWRN